MSTATQTAAKYSEEILKGFPSHIREGFFPPLKLCVPTDALVRPDEFLWDWLKFAKRNADGRIPLALVIGETDADHRDSRSQAALSGKFTMAKTCDGVFGARVIVGLLQSGVITPSEVDFSAGIDEWPSTARCLDSSHLLIIGSPEVNLCAAFLNGLVPEFYFGNKPWPPNFEKTGDMFCLQGRPYHRNPSDNRQCHDGGVFLLKNPWNPDYRLLWIAGVSGRGSGNACSFLNTNWSGVENDARSAIGVLTRSEVCEGKEQIAGRYWLRRQGGDAPGWEGSFQSTRPQTGVPPVKGDSFDAFLSYNSKDRQLVEELRNRLVAKQLKLWYDQDECRPGVPWQNLLEEGIKHSKSIVVAVGPSGIAPWEDEELRGALAWAVKDGRPVIPVLLPGASAEPTLPLFLTNRTWVNQSSGFTGEGLDNLYWGITGRRVQGAE